VGKEAACPIEGRQTAWGTSTDKRRGKRNAIKGRVLKILAEETAKPGQARVEKEVKSRGE